MPKILLFVACEKMIVDAQSNSTSLIGLLDSISIPTPEGKPVPQDANSPMRWDILAIWLRQPGDEGQVYEQRTYLVQPNGQPKIDGTTTFEMLDHRQDVVANITGLPIGVVGESVVVLSYRKADTDDSWQEVARYPIQIVHEVMPVIPVLPSIDKV